jgi:hypothetical protein
VIGRSPRIVLTMIVKNEALVIRRCLESIKPFIAAWSISDTGSTDGTQALIRDLLGDLPGELIERPWQDFSTNRNEAIENGLKFEPDYFVTLDADEMFTTSPGFSLRGLAHDSYDAMFEMAGTSGRWPRRLLFRPHLRYKYVLDEVLEQGNSHGILPACLVKSHTDGARSQAGMYEKFRRDAEVLKKAAEAEPNEPRYWFYLAQRLRGSGQYAEAIDAYQRRVDIDAGLQPERAYSMLMIGQCLEELRRPFPEVQAAYLKAFQMNPNRAEPLYALGCVHSVRGEHALAEIYAREAQRIQRPNDPLVADESVYAYRAVELLAGALAEQGKAGEARDLLEKLVVLPQLPREEHERVQENIALLRKAQGDDAPKQTLGPDELTYASQAAIVRSEGLAGFRRLGLEFLQSFQAQAFPSPVRWLWILLTAFFGRWASIAGAVAAAPLAAWSVSPLIGIEPAMLLAAGSPLLFLAGRRRLQDAPVAALTLAAIGFAVRGNAAGMGLALFALVSLKEASVLVLPALAFGWIVSGANWIRFAGSAATAGTASLAVLLALFGSMLPAMLKAAAAGHATPYTKDYQKGAAHRLLVDLVLVSPVTTLAALYGPPEVLSLAALLVGAHLLAPVRNVRLVLAADLLLRVAAVFAFGWWIAPAIAIDIYISRRLRPVYDPVTAALTSQLGMTR